MKFTKCYHIGQIIKMTSTETNQPHVPPDVTDKERHIASVVFLPSTPYQKVIRWKHQTNQTQGTSYKISGLFSSNMQCFMGYKERLNYSRLKETKWYDNWQTHTWSGVFFCNTEHYWDNWWNLNKTCRLTRATLIFWFWSLCYSYVREYFWFFRKYTEIWSVKQHHSCDLLPTSRKK